MHGTAGMSCGAEVTQHSAVYVTLDLGQLLSYNHYLVLCASPTRYRAPKDDDDDDSNTACSAS
jgi:hypothetical protein